MTAETRQTHIDCVEHDLHRDEHQDDVAPCQESKGSDSEQNRTQCQNHIDGNNHAALLRARTTAPMIAARRRSEAISKGKTNGPNSAVPIARRFP